MKNTGLFRPGLAVLVALIATACSTSSEGSSKPPVSSSTTSATTGAASPGGLVEFRDEESRFAVGYPADWQRLQSGDPGVKLVVTKDERDSFLARVVKLDTPADTPALTTFQALTDEIVKSSAGTEVLQGPTKVDLGGLAGLWYFYRFTDAGSGQRGVHSHYFLARGSTMLSLVFQSLPEDSFKAAAPVFDQMVASFRGL
jgi:hypothetical protein